MLSVNIFMQCNFENEIIQIQSIWRMHLTRKLYRLTMSRLQSERKRTFEAIESNCKFVNDSMRIERPIFLKHAKNVIFKNFPGIKLENEKIMGRKPNEKISIKAVKDSIGRTCPLSMRQHSANSIYFILTPSLQTVVVKCFKCTGNIDLNVKSSIFDDIKDTIVISDKKTKKTKTKQTQLENLDQIQIVNFEHNIIYIDTGSIIEFYDMNRFCQVAAKLNKKCPVFSNWTNRTYEENEPIDFKYNNIAIICGIQSNIFVIDIDVGDNGLQWFKQLCSKHNYNYPNATTAVRTPSGGIHLYYKYNEHFSNNSVRMRCGDQSIGIDIRSNAGVVICPPSKYLQADGSVGKYEFLCMKTPCECPDFIIQSFINETT